MTNVHEFSKNARIIRDLVNQVVNQGYPVTNEIKKAYEESRRLVSENHSEVFLYNHRGLQEHIQRGDEKILGGLK